MSDHGVGYENYLARQDGIDIKSGLTFKDKKIADLEQQVARLTEFTPTSENINALPEGIRQFIHDLETRCDPAGDVAALTLLKDQLAGANVKIERLTEENEGLTSSVGDLGTRLADAVVENRRLTEERDAALRGEEVANRLLDDYRASLAAKDEALRELEYEASYELGRTASGKFPRREFGFAVEKARAARKSGTSDD